MSWRRARPSLPLRRPSQVPGALLAAVALVGSACSGSSPPRAATAVGADITATAPPPVPGALADRTPSGDRADECVALMGLVHATLLAALAEETSTPAGRADLEAGLADLRARAPEGFDADLAAMEGAVAAHVLALEELYLGAASVGTWPGDHEVAQLVADATTAFEAAGAEVLAWVDAECGPDVVGPSLGVVPGA